MGGVVEIEPAETYSRDALMTDTAFRTNGPAGGAARRERPDGSASRVSELEAEVAALRRALARAGLDAGRAAERHGTELAGEQAGRVADAAGARSAALDAAARHGRKMAASRADLAVEGGRWHVAPSGMLETAPRLPLHATAAREGFEELGISAAPEAFRLLGVGWDLRRLTPEVALRLDLEADAGLAGRLAPDEFTEGRIWPLDDLAGFWAAHGPEELTPPAAAAVALLQASLAGEGRAG